MSPLADPTAVFPDLFRDDVLHIETLRLWLRWPALSDVEALHAVAWREALARNSAAWPRPFPEGEPRRWIGEVRAGNEAGLRLDLAIADKSRPGRLIGLIGVRAIGRADELSLGFLLDAEHQGRGLMTEAVRAFAGAVFRYTRTQVMHGSSGIDNAASRRALEKAGFRCVQRGAGTRVATRKVERGEALNGCPSLELHRTAWIGGRPRKHARYAADEQSCDCTTDCTT